MRVNSKLKGKAAELEVVRIMNSHGWEMRRSAQYCGNTGDAPDVVGDFPFHVEVKHQEKLVIDEWWEQAVRDAKDRIPMLVFRKNRQRWRVVMDFETFLDIVAKVYLTNRQ